MARAARLRVELAAVGCSTELIAQAIVAECRMRPRAAWRYAAGLSGQQAADSYNQLYGTAVSPTPMSKARISEYETWPMTGAARRPAPHVLAGLAALYGAELMQLLDAHDVRALGAAGLARLRQTHPPATSPSTAPSAALTEAGDDTNRRNALKALGVATATAATAAADLAHPRAAMGYTLDLERTDLGPSTLEHLQVQLTQLGSSYASNPPAATWATAATAREHTARLLAGRHTLEEGRELARVAGMFSVVLAWLAHDMGATALAESWCVDAYAHGRQSEVPEVCAWADDARTTIALYDDRPTEALGAAMRGLAAAPTGTAAAARLSAQVSRATAKAGRADAFDDAHRIARRHAEHLPAHGAGLFGADAVRLASYDASSHLWLGAPRQALDAAEQAIAQYRAVPYGKQAPTRMAIAQIDLAAARAELGELDGALDAGRQALACRRLVGSIVARSTDLGRALQHIDGRAPEVRAFTAEVRAARPALPA